MRSLMRAIEREKITGGQECGQRVVADASLMWSDADRNLYVDWEVQVERFDPKRQEVSTYVSMNETGRIEGGTPSELCARAERVVRDAIDRCEARALTAWGAVK